MATQQPDRKPDATITGAKIALIGTLAAALIGATASITVALVQSPAPAKPTSVNPSPPAWWPTTRVFNESALEEGVEKILISEYGVEADQIQTVDCPARQEVKLGNKFTCTVTLGSRNDPQDKAVDITVREEDTGQYEVSRPRTK